jgi:hypothetical protein
MTIQGGAPANGKVLTSDASGNASWQSLTSGAVPGSVVSAASLTGNNNNNIPTASNVYEFTGPTANITLTANQRVVMVCQVALGRTAAAMSVFRLDVGYQLVSGGTVYNAAVGDYIDQSPAIAAGERNTYTVTGSFKPGAGTWKIGPVIYSSTTGYFNNDDFTNGYYMIINE